MCTRFYLQIVFGCSINTETKEEFLVLQTPQGAAMPVRSLPMKSRWRPSRDVTDIFPLIPVSFVTSLI